MSQAEYLLIIAYQSQAMLLFNVLRKIGYDIKLVATPCSLGKGCSRSIRFNEVYLDRVKEEAKKNNITVKGLYKISRDAVSNQTIYKKVQGSN